MDDMISRQAAIDALHMHLIYRIGTDSNKKRLDDWINGVPSAQPEIIRCKDCKYWMRAYLSISGKHGCNVMRDYTAPDDYCFKAERKEDEYKGIKNECDKRKDTERDITADRQKRRITGDQ